jgi:hypothetical protein
MKIGVCTGLGSSAAQVRNRSWKERETSSQSQEEVSSIGISRSKKPLFLCDLCDSVVNNKFVEVDW